MNVAFMLQRRIEKKKGVNFYDCTAGIWGGKNFMRDMMKGGAMF